MAAKRKFDKETLSRFLEIISTGLIVAGAFWTALGVHLSKDEVLDLQAGNLSLTQVGNLLIKASNFATQWSDDGSDRVNVVAIKNI